MVQLFYIHPYQPIHFAYMLYGSNGKQTHHMIIIVCEIIFDGFHTRFRRCLTFIFVHDFRLWFSILFRASARTHVGITHTCNNNIRIFPLNLINLSSTVSIGAVSTAICSVHHTASLRKTKILMVNARDWEKRANARQYQPVNEPKAGFRKTNTHLHASVPSQSNKRINIACTWNEMHADTEWESEKARYAIFEDRCSVFMFCKHTHMVSEC